MFTLGIITARGGSKRIPRKNLKAFHGRPMLAWPLEAALRSALFDALIVSTDDEEIADIARSHGATIPFLRPAELSDDHTPTLAVVRHALAWWETHRNPVDVACCLYPTAPFLREEDLKSGLEALKAHPDAGYAISVTRYGFPIFRALQRGEDGRLGMFWPENESRRSQDLPEAWHDAAMFYWGSAQTWKTQDRFFSANSLGIPIPRRRVQDIDTPEDWEQAEAMASVLLASKE